MKLYHLYMIHWHLLPFEPYKDKLVVLVLNNAPGESTSYQIIRDCTIDYRRNFPTYMILLYNLAPEDFTHLNLLGIPINPNEIYENSYLELAIIRNDLSISYKDLYKDRT